MTLVPARALLYGAMGAYAAGFATLAVLAHRAFNTGRFDLGNMTQAVWTTAHGHPLEITDLQGEQTSRLAAHFDPILAAFAPLWWLWPSASLLLVVQAALIALGALPVFWLARKHLNSERAGVGFALAYLLYPPVQWLALDEFHAIALATPLLLFAVWYLDENRLVPFVLFALLASTTREEIVVVVAGLGAWFALSRKRWLAGGGICATAAVASVIVIGLVLPHFNEGTSSRFYNRYRDVGGSPRGILETAVTDPLDLLTIAFDGRGVHYLAQLGLPLLGLWILAPLALVAALPVLALNLLSSVPTQTSIYFHYTAAEIPIFVFATILGAGRLTRTRPAWTTPVVVAAVAAALVANYRLGAIPLWHAFPGGSSHQARDARVSEHDRIARHALARIPDIAVVSASNSLGAHLSSRRRILSFPRLENAAWVAADETRPSYGDRLAPLPMAAALSRLRRDPSWRLVFQRDGILVFRRTG